MSYQCQACGHKMRKAQGGACPACHSMSLKSIRSSVALESAKPSKTKLELCLTVLLWSLLVYGIYDRYLRNWVSAL